VGRNRILNNLVQDSLGACPVYVGSPSAVLDGNIYHAKGPVQAFWKKADGEKTYNLSQGEGLAAYRRDTEQDVHSRVAEVAFLNSERDDFRLAAGSAAVDAGQPLTRTTNAGTGSVVPVEDVSCFSAGLKTRAGEVLMQGDEITIADSRARITALDRSANTLTLDRPLRWQKGDPVSYPFAGKGPDGGAFESGFAKLADGAIWAYRSQTKAGKEPLR
jgi:hypothetical protein